VIAKDVLIAGAVATGVANMIGGVVVHDQVKQRGEPGEGTPAESAAARTFMKYVGPLHAALVAGAIGVNAALAQESGRSVRWSGVSRLLP
jgi:hypothetical protein